MLKDDCFSRKLLYSKTLDLEYLSISLYKALQVSKGEWYRFKMATAIQPSLIFWMDVVVFFNECMDFFLNYGVYDCIS